MSEAALSIYRRSEAYYLVVSAQTSAGVWQHVAESPTVLDRAVDPARLGGEVLGLLAARPKTAHPGREEWTEFRRRSVAPILRAAKVRSWKAFATAAALTDISRTRDTVTVTPMAAVAPPVGSFEPDTDREQTLRSPSSYVLGICIVQAFLGGELT